MKPKALVVIAVLIAAAALLAFFRRDSAMPHYTGFVEGEERILRSEVSGRVLEVRFAEGAAVPPEEVIARLDDRDMRARLLSKRQELAVVDADIRTQSERITLLEATWTREVNARRADLRQAEAGAQLADRTFAREQELVRNGASTQQLLDDTRAQRDQAGSMRERARQMLARTEAEEASIAVARHELATLRARRELIDAQLGELEVTHSKYLIQSPGVETVLQTQFIWPGELAQPGTPIVAVLDPKDKYVQVYVPVSDVAQLPLGKRVEVELDSQPGRRFPGEVSFVAEQASFTPEKIETRSDRMGQVYRAKVRILDGVEHLQPGTEGNVYLLP
jgi:HlyD family secretion protein